METPSVNVFNLGDEVQAVDRDVLVVLENLDEGLCGDYNPEDPDDINLMRFTVYRRLKPGGELFMDNWEQVDDASYCTRLPADTPSEILEKAARYLLKEFSDVLNSDPEQSVKKLGERLSWISPDMFK